MDDAPRKGVESESQESASLDNLIRGFEDQAGDKPAKPREDIAKALTGLKPVVDFAKSEMNRKSVEAVQEDVGSAISFMKESTELKDVGNPVVRGLMEAYAAENDGFAKAFQKRGDNPTAWKQALKEGRDWAVEQIKGIPGMNTARDDIEAAEAAVAGTDSTERAGADDDLPSTTDMMNMSGVEWQRFMSNQAAKAG